VIDNTEDNFDAYGELGNVYFNQGKKQQAASAYFEAAAILIKKGQVNRAQSLMGLLRHLDKAKADELQALIESATS
jgi:tetratricopeptide (TPR) repeat protein